MTEAQPTCVTEIWKPVVGWEGLYEVSSFGRVRSLDRLAPINDAMGRVYERRHKGRVLAQATGERGRLIVCLSLNGVHESWLVHRIVCLAFHGPAPTSGHEVAHRNGKPWMNAADNLRWLTTLENNREQDLHGTRPRGEMSCNAKLTDRIVIYCRKEASSGRTIASLAREMGVTHDTISKAVRRKTWSHLV